MNDIATYQYSIFTKNGKDEQFVIRANTWEEFVAAKKNLDTILTKIQSPKDEMNGQTPDSTTRICKEHGVPMLQGYSKTKKKDYFYHDSEAGIRCFGHGYMDK